MKICNQAIYSFKSIAGIDKYICFSRFGLDSSAGIGNCFKGSDRRSAYSYDSSSALLCRIDFFSRLSGNLIILAVHYVLLNVFG